MSYTQNPHIPKVRRDAADMVRRGYTPTEVGRRFGVGSSTICKWVRKAQQYGYHPIPTLSAKPKHHPKQLPDELVWKIFQTRLMVKRSSEVIHQILKENDVSVSLSSVKRTLDRTGLLKKRSPYKRHHPHVDRPLPEKPGSLVQLDTIHTMLSEKKRMYTFTLIDVFSRSAYAKTYAKMNAAASVQFVAEAEAQLGFPFEMLQSDHGPEFGKWFVERIQKKHRYSRIGKPNDNAHIERFNRTVQEECLDNTKKTPEAFNTTLKAYLRWYNTERHHFGLNLKTPRQVLTERVQAID